VRRPLPAHARPRPLDRGDGLLVVLPELPRRQRGHGPRLRRRAEHRGRPDRPLTRLLRPRLVARRLPLDGEGASVPRAGPETRARRTADGRGTGPSRPVAAPRTRGETGGPAPHDQGRGTSDADAVGRRPFSLRRGPRPLSRGTQGDRGEAEAARRGTGGGAVLTGRAHGPQARDRGPLGPRAVAGQARGAGRPRRGHGGVRGADAPPQVVRGLVGGRTEEGRREGWHGWRVQRDRRGLVARESGPSGRDGDPPEAGPGGN